MEKESEKTVVNSWNEWDPLKHIIVGRADNACIPHREPAVENKAIGYDVPTHGGPRSLESIERANELLDNFTKIQIASNAFAATAFYGHNE